MAQRSVKTFGIIFFLMVIASGCASGGMTESSSSGSASGGGTRSSSASNIDRVASGSAEDTVNACLARIPQDASAGQKMLAEESCRRDQAARR